MQDKIQAAIQALKTRYQAISKEEVGMALFALAFLITGQLARFIFRTGQTYPAVLLAPNGIALAALIIYGKRYWPFIAVSATVNALLNGIPFLGAFLASLLFAFQAFIGADAFHYLKLDKRFSHFRDLMWFCIIALFTSTIVPTGGIYLFSMSQLTTNVGFFYWWLGHCLSALVLTPFIVQRVAQWRPQPIRISRAEIVSAFTLLIVANFFAWFEYPQILQVPLVIALIVISIWIAVRMGMRRMSLAVFVSTLIILSAPFYGFKRPPAEFLGMRIIESEIYIAIMTMLFYLLASAFEERDEAFATLKQSVEELERSNQKILDEDTKKNDFIAVLAHELRNPLAPISNNLQLMEHQGIKNTPFGEATRGIQKQVHNITRLLEDLLDVSRVTKGKIELKKKMMDLRESIQAAIESVEPIMTSQRHTLKILLPPTPVWVIADPLRLEQIFINLLNNAAKYTNPGGVITISLSQEGGYAITRVSDNGIGFENEMQQIIFDPFTQADSSITRSQGGLGIGLTLVKLLTELHGGTVEAKSDGANHGSEFSVSIPIRTGPVDVAAANLSIQNPERSMGNEILVVDDDKDVLESLVRLLDFLGYSIVSASSGVEALRIAKERRPGLVLLDIGLPGMSGYDVAKILRQDFGKAITLIAISGFGQAEDKEKAKIAGFDTHLTKPVSVKEIEEAVRRVRP